MDGYFFILNAPGNNLVANSGFENNEYTNTPTGWTTWLSRGTTASTIKTESRFVYDGNYNLTFWNVADYSGSIYQDIKNLSKGTYTLSVWVTSGGNQKECQIYAKNYGGNELDTDVPLSDTGWVKVQIKNIKVTNGTCQIGLYTVANAGNWCSADNFSLRKVLDS